MTSDTWLDHVRFARDCGQLSLLFPDGITTIRDLPYNIFDAIRMALMWLTFEELESAEQPPKKIWLDNKAMKAWWKAVNKRRHEKYGMNSDKGIDGPVERNALADELLR